MKVTDPPIIVEQTFNHPVDIVWNAITEHSQMIQWFFDNIPEFKAEVGFRVKFNVQALSRDFLHLWEITEVVPFQKIVYNWKYLNVKGDSYVTFAISKENEKTKLRLITKVIEDFDDNIPEFTPESCLAGWHYFINKNLTDFLRS